MSRARRPLGSWPAAVRLRAMRWCPAGRDTMLQLAAAGCWLLLLISRQAAAAGGRPALLAGCLAGLAAGCLLLAAASYY
jgi:hypothetical protein